MSKGGYRPGSGRKKGAATLYSEALKAEIAKLVQADAPELIKAQIEKAKKGDTQAFNSLLDRFMGKPAQAITGEDGNLLQIIFDGTFNKDASS